jgi:hypothetical protein
MGHLRTRNEVEVQKNRHVEYKLPAMRYKPGATRVLQNDVPKARSLFDKTLNAGSLEFVDCIGSFCFVHITA